MTLGERAQAVLGIDPEAEGEQARLGVERQLQRPDVELLGRAQPQRLAGLREREQAQALAVEGRGPLQVGDGHLHVAQAIDHDSDPRDGGVTGQTGSEHLG